jgi:hypothetical protein
VVGIVGGQVETHCYAVVGYNPSSSLPFEVYNPWGTNSSGWALGTFNGRQVYGLFNANAAFISQNSAGQEIGAGAANDKDGKVTPQAADALFALFEFELRPKHQAAQYGVGSPLV